MSNLKELAFPIAEPGDPKECISLGFTKHEYAAILLANGLLSKYEFLPNSSEKDEIAACAYDLAEKVLSYFK